MSGIGRKRTAELVGRKWRVCAVVRLNAETKLNGRRAERASEAGK